MDIFEMHKSLVEKWKTQEMQECLIQEVFELQAANAKTIEKILDLSNRLRHLEFQACPIQNADFDEAVLDLNPFTKKP